MNKLLRAGTIALISSATFMSCLPGRSKAPGGIDYKDIPPRPMLPDNEYPSLDNMKRPEGHYLNSYFPFSTSYVTLPVNGENKEFIFVSLPNNLSDSLANDLASKYKSMAGTLIDQWASHNTGILVDLRTTGKKADKADLIIKAEKGTFPLVLVWDAEAVDRLPAYISLLKAVPGLQVPDSAFIKNSDLNILPSGHLSFERSLIDENAPIPSCFQ